MANYIKSTDFAAKDALLTGNPAKIIKGTEVNDEFNNIQTAVATKADITSPALLGNPTAPTQAYGNNTTRLATTAFVQAALQALYPIGTIYTSVVSTNPNTLFGFGTWVAFGAGRVMVGYDSGNTLFDSVEETGGSYNAVVVSHTHTITDPGHTHANGEFDRVLTEDGTKTTVTFDNGINQPNIVDNRAMLTKTTGITVDSSGVSGTNANIQPYITVYMWKRTA